MVRGERMSLENKVALVTGSGRGIGRTISLELARLGLVLVVNGRKDEIGLKETISEIESFGGRAMAILADVTIPGEVELIVSRVREELGEIQVLVNNVGDFLSKPLLEVTPDEWKYIFASNLHSAFFTSRAVINGMIEKGWGRIVNIGLAGSEIPGAPPGITPYAAAKTGMLVLTKCLAREVAGKGITVNMVAPGIIEAPGDDVPEDLVSSIPAGRPGRPEEIAQMVSFLVTEATSYITGACISVGGGWESVR
jgi:NAD(P)-dependent dehydrogenase (short-subunit alcohol dehydrogenase family)